MQKIYSALRMKSLAAPKIPQKIPKIREMQFVDTQVWVENIDWSILHKVKDTQLLITINRKEKICNNKSCNSLEKIRKE